MKVRRSYSAMLGAALLMCMWANTACFTALCSPDDAEKKGYEPEEIPEDSNGEVPEAKPAKVKKAKKTKRTEEVEKPSKPAPKEAAKEPEGTCAEAQKRTQKVPAATEKECRDAESSCDGAVVMSEAGAHCLAKEAGLAKGVKPWEASLSFDANNNRLVWNISSETGKGAIIGGGGDKMDGVYGEMVVLDATTGKFIEKDGWSIAW